MLPNSLQKPHRGKTVESRAKSDRARQMLLQELCAARHEGVSLDGLTAYLVGPAAAARQRLGNF